VSGGHKFGYRHGGRSVEKWRKLHSVGLLTDRVYFVNGNDWTKCKQISFGGDCLLSQAKETQMLPGQSIRGWLFFEIEKDLRGQVPYIRQLSFTIVTSTGDKQTVVVDYPKKGTTFPQISSGVWRFQEGFRDLTQEEFVLCPVMDLRDELSKKKT
jgi:hypothetical protein